MNRNLPALLALLALGLPLHASQAVDEEVARYMDGSDKANRTYQEGLAKERTRSLAALSAAAKRSKGDAESLDALWKLVLQLDDMNAEAREHFTSTGKLAAVLKDLAKRKGPLLGDAATAVVKKAEPKIDMSGAKAIRITSSYNAGYTLGSFKSGTVLIFQYVSGTWSGNNEANDAAKNQSPDAEASDAGNRVQVFVDSGNTPVVLTQLPPGTAEKPFIYTLDRDVVGLSLRIVTRTGVRNRNPGGGGNGKMDLVSSYTGDVKYLVRIVR